MAGFDYMARTGELLEEGLTVDEIAEIVEKESSESDFCILDDGSWFGLADQWAEEAERDFQASMA